MKIIKLGKRGRKRLYWFISIAFLAINIVAYLGAYVLTHFSSPGEFSLGLSRPISSKLPIDLGLKNPVEYASQVKCPTLILQGKLDKWTMTTEIDRIYENLRGSKQLSIFPTAGHDLLVTVDRERWKQSIDKFLKEVKHK
jgi:alpha-beta hydrolase superfamily lysophospholipase